MIHKAKVPQFIVIKSGDAFVDDQVLSIDTEEEREEAQKALQDAGLNAARVWAGDAEDSVDTGLLFFACKGV